MDSNSRLTMEENFLCCTLHKKRDKNSAPKKAVMPIITNQWAFKKGQPEKRPTAINAI